MTYHSITRMAAYKDKSFEELRWEHYSEENNLEAQPPAEPPVRIATPPRFGQKRWQKFHLSFLPGKRTF